MAHLMKNILFRIKMSITEMKYISPNTFKKSLQKEFEPILKKSLQLQGKLPFNTQDF